MAWTTEFSREAERDLALIFDHLFETYTGFGEDTAEAFDRATARISRIRSVGKTIADGPPEAVLDEPAVREAYLGPDVAGEARLG